LLENVATKGVLISTLERVNTGAGQNQPSPRLNVTVLSIWQIKNAKEVQLLNGLANMMTEWA
jgi:hypothetical protein